MRKGRTRSGIPSEIAVKSPAIIMSRLPDNFYQQFEDDDTLAIPTRTYPESVKIIC